MRINARKIQTYENFLSNSSLLLMNVQYSEIIGFNNLYRITLTNSFKDPKLNHSKNICLIDLKRSELIRLYNQIGKILLAGENK